MELDYYSTLFLVFFLSLSSFLCAGLASFPVRKAADAASGKDSFDVFPLCSIDNKIHVDIFAYKSFFFLMIEGIAVAR